MATANIDIRNLQVGGLIQAGQVIDLCNIHTDGVSDGYLVTHSGDAPLSLPSSLKGKVKAWSVGGKCVQDGTPTPQSPVAIESIGTYDSESGKYEVVLKAMSQNLLNKAEAVDGGYYNGSGQIVANTNSFYVDEYIEVVGGTKITIGGAGTEYVECRLVEYNASKQLVDHWPTYNRTITLNANTRYIRISGLIAYKDTMMIVRGNTAPSSYVPYFMSSLSALLASPLRGKGNVTDIMDNTGAVTHRFGVVDLGSLTYNYDSVYSRFFCTLPGVKGVSGQYNLNLMCTGYKISTSIAHGNAYVLGTSLYLVNTDYTDATAFKTAMSGVMLVYELATPTTETAVISGSLKTTKGTTILDVDGSVKGNVEATYLSSVRNPVTPLLGLGAPLMGAMPSDEDEFNEEEM